MNSQVLPVEQIEHKLQGIANRKEKVGLRIPLFGGVEMVCIGNLLMGFDREDFCPFFSVIHNQQYATSIRFYGTDVMAIRRLPGEDITTIYLGVPIQVNH